MSNVSKTLWNDDYLKSFAKRVILSNTSVSIEKSLVFWYEDEKSGDFKINRHLLISRFFPALGVRNLVLGKNAKGLDSALPVFIRENRVEEINGEILKSISFKVLDYYAELCGDTDEPEEVRTALGFCKEVFESKGLRAIPDLYDKSVVTDTPISALRFFTNGWVEIDKNGVSCLQSYNEFPEDKIIWNNSVIERDYLFAEDVTASLHNLRVNRIHPVSGEYVNTEIMSAKQLKVLIKEYEAKEKEQKETIRETHYRDFVSNLARNNDGDVCPITFERLKIGIGYLCHRHHFSDRRKWVEIVDKDFDVSRRVANGGNGKSIFLAALKNVMNVTEISGKEFKKGRSDTFAFADVTPSTEICFFDDADENFDITRLYTRTTGDFHVRRMRQNPFSIDRKNAPKLAIATNYPLGNNDFSTRRRQFVIEVSSYYKDALETYGETPCDIHGGKMLAEEGGGWNETDWSEFYRFIWECISTYLSKGLPANEETSENFKRSQLIGSFNYQDGEELLDFYLNYLHKSALLDVEVFVDGFYQDVRNTFPNLPKDWNNERLYRHLKECGAAFKINPNKGTNGALKQVRLTGENWQRWVDAGLEGHTKPSGDEFVIGDRVRVFSVTQLSNPNSFFIPVFTNTDDERMDEITDEAVLASVSVEAE